jgi:hypothetical protein
MGLPVYVRQNQAVTDYFTYLSAGVPVTGKTNASFTRQLAYNGIGNQSTAGITIAEVDATNNPGLYSITMPSSIFANTGDFDLLFFDTGSTTFRWEQQWRCTSDGTGAGTLGAVSFTAVTANGRVTDGSSPISGATVTIRTATGLTWATLITDASGLWGPVYFTSNSGSYGIYVNKSGYAQASATLTAGVSTVTGPGADIVAAIATSTSGQTFADLLAYARRMGRDVTGTKADTELKQAVNEALEVLAKSHHWPRFLTIGQISLNAAQSITVSLTTGSSTVTLTSGTWPTWANSTYAKLYINGQILRVATATVSTTATIENAWAAASSAATACVLFQDEYLLPNDLFNVSRLLPGTRWSLTQQASGPDLIMACQSAATYGQRIAAMWGVIKQQLLLYPYPSQNDLLSYAYWRKPTDLVSGTDIADWDPAQNEVLRRAIDYTVSLRYGGYAGGTTEQAYAQFKEALARSIPNDRESSLEDAVLGNDMTNLGVLWRRRQGSP